MAAPAGRLLGAQGDERVDAYRAEREADDGANDHGTHCVAARHRLRRVASPRSDQLTRRDEPGATTRPRPQRGGPW